MGRFAWVLIGPLALAGLLAPGWWPAGPAAAAGFDCAKARSKVEKLICRDQTLNRLDGEMAEAYANALKAWDGRIAGYVKLTQRSWVNGSRVLEPAGGDRGGVYCHDDAGAAACLVDLYRDRLAILRGPALRLSGIYEKGGGFLKLLASPDGLSLEWSVGDDTGGSDQARPVPAGATDLPFAFDDDACRLHLIFAADAVTVRQDGPCGEVDLAGKWVRNPARDPGDELF
jgi:uncharacterized protein YecT (DUF1311 family)